MRVFTVYRPEMQRLDVYVESAPGQYAVAATTSTGARNDAIHRYVDVPPGGDPPRFISLPIMLAEALSQALQAEPGVKPEAGAVRHLNDAIEVRDRLLKLVEQRTEADVRPPIIISGDVRRSDEP